MTTTGVRADEWLFLTLVAIVPIMQGVSAEFGGHIVPAADFLFPLVVTAFVASVMMGKRHVRWIAWHVPLLLFSAAIIASTVASEDRHRSLVKLAGDLYLCVLAFLTTNYVISEAAVKRVLVAWLVGTMITVSAAALGVALFYAGVRPNPFLNPFGSLPPGSYPRVMALFLNANMLCTYIVASAMIVIAARTAGWISGRVFALFFAGTVFTAVLTLSPGLGGMCLVLGLWYGRVVRNSSPRWARAFSVAAWAGAVVFFLATTISPTVLMHRDTADMSLGANPSSRVMTWTGAWHTFRGHPWLGKGLGLEAAAVHYITASGNLENLTDAHNTWLSILAQDGVVGFAAFAVLVGFIACRFQTITIYGPNILVIRSAVELAWAGGFVYQTLSGSFENTRHVWLLTGLVASIQQMTSTGVPARGVDLKDHLS